MRVLHVASGDLWGGAESQLCGLMRESQRLDGIDAEAVLFNAGLTAERLAGTGIRVNVIDESRHDAFGILRRMARLLRQSRAHVLHTHGYKECVLGSLAAQFAGGIPCVRTVHGWVERPARFWQPTKMAVRMAEILALRYQKAVVAVSAELESRLTAYVGNKKVVTIENGIEVSPIIERPQRNTSDVRRVAIVGRLVPVKRVDLFLRACHLLKNWNGGRIEFVIVGDGPLMPEIQRLVDDLGLRQQTRLPGFVSNVTDCLRKLDALLVTSDHEGLPMVVLEAMACGVPVVAHAVGGVPTVLADGACGWLVHQQEPEEYSRAVRDVLENGVVTRRKTVEAYHRVSERYSARRMAERYQSLYRVIAAGGDLQAIGGQEC